MESGNTTILITIIVLTFIRFIWVAILKKSALSEFYQSSSSQEYHKITRWDLLRAIIIITISVLFATLMRRIMEGQTTYSLSALLNMKPIVTRELLFLIFSAFYIIISYTADAAVLHNAYVIIMNKKMMSIPYLLQ